MSNDHKKNRNWDQVESYDEPFETRKRVKTMNELKLLSTYDSDSEPDLNTNNSENGDVSNASCKLDQLQRDLPDNENSDLEIAIFNLNSSKDKDPKNRTTTNIPIIIDGDQEPTSVSTRHTDIINETDLHELEKDFEVGIEPFNIETEIGANNFNKDGYYERDHEFAEVSSEEFSKEIDDIIKTSATPESLDVAMNLLMFITKSNRTVMQSLGDLNKMGNTIKDEQYKQYFSNSINMLTEAVDLLENNNYNNLYQSTKEDIITLRRQELVTDKRLETLWSYKRLEKPDHIYEEHSTKNMNYWSENQFREKKVLVKLQTSPDTQENWIPIICVDFA